LGQVKKISVKPTFIGGETIPESVVKVSGVDFYDSVKRWGPLALIYRLAERKIFDLYEVCSAFALGLSRLLSWLHNGLLHTYLAWMFAGALVLFYLLLR